MRQTPFTSQEPIELYQEPIAMYLSAAAAATAAAPSANSIASSKGARQRDEGDSHQVSPSPHHSPALTAVQPLQPSRQPGTYPLLQV